MLKRLWDLEVYEPLWPSPVGAAAVVTVVLALIGGMGCRLGSSHLGKLHGLGNGSKATTEIRNKEELHGGLIQAQLCEQTSGVDVER